VIKKQLHEVAKIIAGQSPTSSTYNTAGDGLPFFQGKADFKEKYPQVRMWCNSQKRKEAEPGDILMSVRAPVGSVNICNQKSIIGRGLAASIGVKSPVDSYSFLTRVNRRLDPIP
jgi:type I restriction enzyme S subunit